MTVEEMRSALESYCSERSCDDCKLHEAVVGKHCYEEGLPNEALKKHYEVVFGSEHNAKADAGKPKLTLVPQKILYDIAEVREYGTKKYHDPDNWKSVEVQRYRDAAFRHFLAYLKEPNGVDKESGISHLKHLACNIAFLCELEDKEND